MQPLTQNVLSTQKQAGPPRSGMEMAPPPSVLPVLPQGARWTAPGFPSAKTSSARPAEGRCSEKGCVFPAAPGTGGKCLHHHRQAAEPILFSSHQPTRIVLERGRFAAAEEEVDTSRSRDRRQLAAIREAFLED